MLLFCTCRNPTGNRQDDARDEFRPKGDISDLVYNPVREDGTIDSSFLPIISWEETVFDFGTIYEGDVVEKDFHFTNLGTAPLLIHDARSTCGCTIPQWPDKPVAPNARGTISVKFDSKNKEGVQNKQVTIFANTYPNKSTITVKGKVEKPN
jgi:hypothetical protein